MARTATAPTEQPPEPTLADRVRAIRAEMDAWLERRVADEQVPGVPPGVIRQLIVNRARCACDLVLRHEEERPS